MQQSNGTSRTGRLVLRELQPDLVAYDLYYGHDFVRPVHAYVKFGNVEFPRLQSDATETLGSDTADAEVRLRASEELVRLAAFSRGWRR